MSSVVIAGDSSGTVTLQAPATAGSTVITLPATSGTLLQSGTTVTEAQGGTGTTVGYNGFKNRIINGAMVIDQRNSGASVTIPAAAQTYTLDRFRAFASQASKFSVQQSTTAPAGFKNSALVTSLSAYTVGASEIFEISQVIEGLNTYDLGFGSATASPVTVSFWVRSSLTGAFGGALNNSAANRCYPFTYTINSANTWEQKSITIAGDTTGTWLTDTGVGINVRFGLGVGSSFSGTANAWASSTYTSATGAVSIVGTNGATWYVTGVQLEKGSTATSFDYRPYGIEESLCQRYFNKLGGVAAADVFFAGYTNASLNFANTFTFPVSMRAAPTSTKVGTWNVLNCGQPVAYVPSTTTLSVYITATANGPLQTSSNGTSTYITNSAEL